MFLSCINLESFSQFFCLGEEFYICVLVNLSEGLKSQGKEKELMVTVMGGGKRRWENQKGMGGRWVWGREANQGLLSALTCFLDPWEPALSLLSATTTEPLGGSAVNPHVCHQRKTFSSLESTGVHMLYLWRSGHLVPFLYF